MITFASLRCPKDSATKPRLVLTEPHTLTVPGITRVDGPNGVGKTTLLRILAGIERDFSGTCEIRPGARLRYVPTEINDLLMPWYSVRQNARVLLNNHRGENDCLAQFERLLGALVPEKAAEICNQRSHRLSAGERAAVAFASALASNPDAILLDETLAHMGGRLLEPVVRELAKFAASGGLVIMVGHHWPPSIVVGTCINITFHREA